MSRMLARMSFLLIFAALLAAGCSKTGIAPPRPLVRPADYNVDHPVVAVGPDGGRHAAWSEYSKVVGRSRIAYRYDGPAGGKTLLIESATDQYFAPDLAVDDDNQVYLVWLRENVATDEESTCWTAFTAGTATIPSCTPIEANAASVSLAAPRIATYGTDALAAYLIQRNGRLYLHVRWLNPPKAPGELPLSVAADSGAFLDPSIGVDSQGVGQVMAVRMSTSPTVSYLLSYSRIEDTLYTTFDALVSSSVSLSGPALDIDRANGDPVYGGVIVDKNKLTTLTIRHTPVWDMTITQPLDAGKGWVIPGAPAITVAPSPYIAFSGRNSDTGGGYDVFYYKISGGSGTLTRLTNDGSAITEGVPEAAAYFDPGGSSPVFAWRAFNAGVYSDVYVYDTQSGIRKAYTSPGTTAAPNLALAGRGNQLAGVFIDQPPDGADQQIPWLAHNAELTYLPAVTR